MTQREQHASQEQAVRTALIVGIGGIGGAIAERLAADGYRIFGTYFSNADMATKAAQQVPAAQWLGACQLDVRDAHAVQEAFSEGSLLDECGGCIDTLVVTTGYRHDLEFFAKQEPGEAERIIATELLGPMNVVREFLKLDGRPETTSGKVTSGRRIVLLGSDSGKAGTMGDAASSAARAGLVGFARSIARETSRTDTTVNVVNPGPTDTPMLQDMLAGENLAAKVMRGTVKAIPKGRLATPEEIAEAVAFLSGPNSGFITGQVLSVSGGLTMA